jgi:hypothetical protein
MAHAKEVIELQEPLLVPAVAPPPTPTANVNGVPEATLVTEVYLDESQLTPPSTELQLLSSVSMPTTLIPMTSTTNTNTNYLVPTDVERRRNIPNNKNRCLCHACIYGYTALDCNLHVLGYSRTTDCLCLRYNFCLAYNHIHYGLGITTNSNDRNEICKVGGICIELGCIAPKTICSGTQQVLCFQSVGSMPFHPDYVPHAVCANYGLSCYPSCDCCVAPPPCPAIHALSVQHHNDLMYHDAIITPTTDRVMYRD